MGTTIMKTIEWKKRQALISGSKQSYKATLCMGQLSNVDQSSYRLVTDECDQVNAFIVGVTSTSSLESESNSQAIA